MKHFTKIQVACVLFAVFIGAIVYAADTGIGKPFFDFVRGFPLGDKISHFFLMGTLATLANLACAGRRLIRGVAVPGLGTTIVAVIVLAEEISQIWIPGRTFEFYDLLADGLGIACGEFVATKLRARR
jgi:polysaccharide biosynthesis protein VpsQ